MLLCVNALPAPWLLPAVLVIGKAIASLGLLIGSPAPGVTLGDCSTNKASSVSWALTLAKSQRGECDGLFEAAVPSPDSIRGQSQAT